MKLWLHPQLKVLNLSLAKSRQVQLTQILWGESVFLAEVFFGGMGFFGGLFCFLNAITILLPSGYNQDIAKLFRLLFLTLFSLPPSYLAPLTCYRNAVAGKSNCGNSGPFGIVKDRTISVLPFNPSAAAQGKHNLLQADSSTLTLSGMGTCSSLTRDNHTLH